MSIVRPIDLDFFQMPRDLQIFSKHIDFGFYECNYSKLDSGKKTIEFEWSKVLT